MGFILWIIVGGVAGYFAERIMKADHTIFMNVGLGIAGSVLANVVLWFLGFNGGGNFLGQLIFGTIGAVVLLYGYREYRRRQA